MRELKFRAWDIDNKQFVYAHIGRDDVWIDDGIGTIEMPFNHSDFEQCTGLKDKNGKEIYEGDILRFKSGPKSVVKFCEIKDSDCTYFYLGWASVQDGCEPMSLCEEAGFCEVIGNIHENPDLLEGEL